MTRESSGPRGDMQEEHLLRRFLCGHPELFRSVRDLGLVSLGCPGGPDHPELVHPRGSHRGSQPHAPRRRLMAFKRMRDWPFIAASTSVFVVAVFYVIQDHPAYIPRGQRWPLRPELAAPLGVWQSSQLTRCAAGRAGWRWSADVAVLSRAILRRGSGKATHTFTRLLLTR
jgi:hypothetical protein